MSATPSPMPTGDLPPEACVPEHDPGLLDADLRGDAGATSAFEEDLVEAAPEPFEAAPRALPAELTECQLAAWIEGIVDHDERALTALYDATLSRVYGIVLRVVRRHQLADEVVEDTYFQVWRQAARFDASRGRALPWLLGMARSRAIDAIRHEARFQHDSLDDDSGPDIEDQRPAADDLLDAARGHADVHRALMLLNAQPRQLVALAFFKGLSHEEIASQTSLPLGTVKSQIRRALLTLRQTLGEGGMHALVS